MYVGTILLAFKMRITSRYGVGAYFSAVRKDGGLFCATGGAEYSESEGPGGETEYWEIEGLSE